MPRVITATLTQCAKGKPLAVLENLPRDGAQLHSHELLPVTHWMPFPAAPALAASAGQEAEK